MSGGEADVKNSIWMRAVLYGGVFLAVGILAFATMSVGVANVKQAEWDEEKLNYERVTEQYTEATADYTQANETYNCSKRTRTRRKRSNSNSPMTSTMPKWTRSTPTCLT